MLAFPAKARENMAKMLVKINTLLKVDRQRTSLLVPAAADGIALISKL